MSRGGMNAREAPRIFHQAAIGLCGSHRVNSLLRESATEVGLVFRFIPLTGALLAFTSVPSKTNAQFPSREALEYEKSATAPRVSDQTPKATSRNLSADLNSPFRDAFSSPRDINPSDRRARTSGKRAAEYGRAAARVRFVKITHPRARGDTRSRQNEVATPTMVSTTRVRIRVHSAANKCKAECETVPEISS